MECTVEGCEREAKTIKYGNLCLLHYKRMARHGTVSENKDRNNARLERENARCKYCNEKVGRGGAKGMCNKHYQMDRLHKDPLFRDNRKGLPGSRGYIRGRYGKPIHRTIVEDSIGRELNEGEVVHHINLIKTDNHIKNLYVCESSSEHTKIHVQLEKLIKGMFEDGTIIFENGIYKRTDKF